MRAGASAGVVPADPPALGFDQWLDDGGRGRKRRSRLGPGLQVEKDQAGGGGQEQDDQDGQSPRLEADAAPAALPGPVLGRPEVLQLRPVDVRRRRRGPDAAVLGRRGGDGFARRRLGGGTIAW